MNQYLQSTSYSTSILPRRMLLPLCCFAFELVLLMNSPAICFAQWQHIGLVNTHISSIHIKDSLILAGADSGHIYRSTDEGMTWTLSVANMPINNAIRSFIAWGDTVLAGAAYTTFGSCFGCGGVYRSTNMGLSWTKTSSGLPDPAQIYTLVRLGTKSLVAADRGLYYSDNDAESWSPVDSNALTTVTVLSLTSITNLLFAGTNGIGVFVSSDSGSMWYPINSGFPRIVDSLEYYPAVFSLYHFQSRLYAGMEGFGAYVSTNLGANWCLLNRGLDSLPLGTMAPVGFAGVNTTLFGATLKKTYTLRNTEMTWADFSSGLNLVPLSRFSAIELQTNSRFIFAGVAGAGKGFWRRRLSDLTGVAEAQSPFQFVPSKRLLQNYPNPFNPTTNIKYQIPQDGLVSLKVYNMLGQEVAKLVNEIRNAGSYEVTFDASNLSSGMYVYRLTTDNFVSSKKLLLLK